VTVIWQKQVKNIHQRMMTREIPVIWSGIQDHWCLPENVIFFGQKSAIPQVSFCVYEIGFSVTYHIIYVRKILSMFRNQKGKRLPNLKTWWRLCVKMIAFRNHWHVYECKNRLLFLPYGSVSSECWSNAKYLPRTWLIRRCCLKMCPVLRDGFV
jgi:hypothetical protein